MTPQALPKQAQDRANTPTRGTGPSKKPPKETRRRPKEDQKRPQDPQRKPKARHFDSFWRLEVAVVVIFAALEKPSRINPEATISLLFTALSRGRAYNFI